MSSTWKSTTPWQKRESSSRSFAFPPECCSSRRDHIDEDTLLHQTVPESKRFSKIESTTILSPVFAVFSSSTGIASYRNHSVSKTIIRSFQRLPASFQIVSLSCFSSTESIYFLRPFSVPSHVVNESNTSEFSGSGNQYERAPLHKRSRNPAVSHFWNAQKVECEQ